MPLNDDPTRSAWLLFSRLGEAQLLLPAAAVLLWLLVRERKAATGAAGASQRGLALQWLLRLATAAVLTTASKLAFIGWGLGSAALDFTGVSGHTAFATATYPLLMAAAVPATWPLARQAAALVGLGLGLAVGLSRLMVDAHTVSEVVAGVLVGGWAGVLALRLGTLRPHFSAALAPLIGLWFVGGSAYAPPSQSHALVTRLALTLSGHSKPYTRQQLRARRSAGPADAGPTAAGPNATGPNAQSAGAPSATVTAGPASAWVIGPRPL
jgi:membrane-associated phospholipid phosphatase